MDKKTVKDINVKGKKCLVRVDFNVPISDGVIMDTTRIEGAIPTINYLVAEGAKVILCSHMGRPKGKVNLELSLAPVAKSLEKLIGKSVAFASDAIGPDAKAKVEALQDGEILLLENLRFYPGEEANDKDFAKGLAEICDVYVNDAFGTAHRAHASTAGIVHFGFVKTAVSGFLIEKELKIIGGALSNAQRPFIAILGGAKVSDKIGVINSFLDKVDTIIIGGAMAYTFAKARGKGVGDSRFEADKLSLALELLDKAETKGVQVLLPVDTVCGDKFSPDANVKVCQEDIDKGWMGLDIGPRTVELFKEAVLSAKTIIWNGPMGVFEMEKFAVGTTAIAEAMVKADAVTIIGGGDSASAVTSLGLASKMTHISTGGGASLEFMEGLVLPGIDCLNDK